MRQWEPPESLPEHVEHFLRILELYLVVESEVVAHHFALVVAPIQKESFGVEKFESEEK